MRGGYNKVLSPGLAPGQADGEGVQRARARGDFAEGRRPAADLRRGRYSYFDTRRDYVCATVWHKATS